MIHNSRIIDIIYRNQVSSYCKARLGQAGLVDSFWKLHAKCRSTHYFFFRGLIREAYIIQSLLKLLLIAQTPARSNHEMRFFSRPHPCRLLTNLYSYCFLISVNMAGICLFVPVLNVELETDGRHYATLEVILVTSSHSQSESSISNTCWINSLSTNQRSGFHGG